MRVQKANYFYLYIRTLHSTLFLFKNQHQIKWNTKRTNKDWCLWGEIIENVKPNSSLKITLWTSAKKCSCGFHFFQSRVFPLSPLPTFFHTCRLWQYFYCLSFSLNHNYFIFIYVHVTQMVPNTWISSLNFESPVWLCSNCNQARLCGVLLEQIPTPMSSACLLSVENLAS